MTVSQLESRGMRGKFGLLLRSVLMNVSLQLLINENILIYILSVEALVEFVF